ncbi:MAG TPA: class I SAM-dependent methyltransferase [Limnobacter sp.]|nr:class I SAM-dependent methyltransferase [Limnobacter sp.]
MHHTPDTPTIHWLEDGCEQVARWQSERLLPPPRQVLVADDTLTADTAYRLASEGKAFLWRSDFQNARQLLLAMARRLDKNTEYKKSKAAKAGKAPEAYPQRFHLYRQAQAQRSRILGSILVPFNADYSIPLRRAPNVLEACTEAWGAPSQEGTTMVASLRELMGMVGAHEWRKKGVEIPALGRAPNNRVHPFYGVFSPVRGEYIDLVSKVPLPQTCLNGGGLALDIGTGTGVLAAVLARRGVGRVLAIDSDARARACAQFNIQNLGLSAKVALMQAELFADQKADLVVCNPPWLPGKPTSPIERAVYDEQSAMLRGVLAGLPAHLNPGGEGWLVLSDLAEHLKLRTREELLGWIAAAGLHVVDRLDAKPRHGKAFDSTDPLFDARSKETTSLWRLAVA